MRIQSSQLKFVLRLGFRQSSRNYSTPALIRTETFAAPHVGNIQLIALNRPEARNAISKSLLAGLRAEIESIDTAPTATRALIITSDVPGIFCAGADLKERATFTLQETRDFLEDLNETFESISALPIPTIAAINGHALGGGLELALNATFRVAHEKAKLGLPETRLGIIPGAGGTFNLPRVIGEQKAMHMILTGHIISGQEVLNIGLCDALAKSTDSGDSRIETIEAALQLANKICEGGPIAVQQALQAVRGQNAMAEVQAYEIVLNTQDRLAALKAFAAKEPVEFSGQ